MEDQHGRNRRLRAAQRSNSIRPCMTPARPGSARFPGLRGSARRSLSAGPPRGSGPLSGGPLVGLPGGAHCPPAERQHGRRVRAASAAGVTTARKP